MTTTKRVPVAPGQPLPALEEFLRPFRVHFARSEATHALERYLTGMFTEHPNKNCDTIAQVVPDTSEQSLQGLLTAMRWDEDDLNEQRVKALLALPTEGDAALIFDDTGFAKQGRASVGVARQYSGTLGKVGNCQVTVNCHYAERTLAWPVATRLYLPRKWACFASVGMGKTDRSNKLQSRAEVHPCPRRRGNAPVPRRRPPSFGSISSNAPPFRTFVTSTASTPPCSTAGRRSSSRTPPPPSSPETDAPVTPRTGGSSSWKKSSNARTKSSRNSWRIISN